MFFADNFRECATPNAFHEEIFKLHFLLNQGRSIFFKRNSFIREDAAFCFAMHLSIKLLTPSPPPTNPGPRWGNVGDFYSILRHGSPMGVGDFSGFALHIGDWTLA